MMTHEKIDNPTHDREATDDAGAWNFPIQLHTLPFATLVAEGVIPMHIGTLNAVSGKIATADALATPVPLDLEVPPESYTLTGFADADGRLGVVAMQRDPLRQDPTHWHLAERLSEDPRFRQFVPIDSGHLVLCDAQHAKEAHEFLALEMLRMTYDPFRLGGLDQYCEISLGERASAWVFRTGWGDGMNPAYVGTYDDGTVGSVIFHFGVWPC